MSRLVDRATDWRWSSLRAQLGLVGDDRLTDTAPVRARYPDFAGHLVDGDDEVLFPPLRRAESIGGP